MRGPLAAAVAGLALLVAAPAAGAATFTVSNTSNTGAGSLRQAMTDANASTATPHTITFTGAGASGEILLASALPEIARDTTIQGPGRAQLSVRRSAAAPSFAIFNVPVGVGATISGLAISGGQADRGAGVHNNGGDLTLRDVRVSGNASVNYGGGVSSMDIRGTLTVEDSLIENNQTGTWGGGIAAYHLIVRRTTLRGNSAVAPAGDIGYGGAIHLAGSEPGRVEYSQITGNEAGWAGGGLHSFGPLTIESSTIADNTASQGGGIAVDQPGALNLRRSTVHANSAAHPGPDADRGGGIRLVRASAVISDSTISANTADGWGAGIAFEGDATDGSVLARSTVSGNSSDYVDAGGGIMLLLHRLRIADSTIARNSASSSFGPSDSANLKLRTYPGTPAAEAAQVSVRNSIIADPLAGRPNCAIDADSTMSSVGFNIVDDSSCGLGGSTDRQGVDPMLGALADNGGPTRTHALLEGSPAIDRGNSDSVAIGVTPTGADQRGLARPSDFPGVPNATGGDGADIGAFELQAPDPGPGPPDPGGSPGPGGESPPNQFILGKVKLNKRKGTARLIVRVPGPGKLVLRKTKQLRKHAVKPESKGKAALKLRPRGKVKRKLARAGTGGVGTVKVRVRAKVTYRPRGGEPRTKVKRVRLVRRAR